MKGISREPAFPRIVSRTLATSGLAADVLAGVPAATGLFGPPDPAGSRAAELRGRAAELPLDAFRVGSASTSEKLAGILAGEGVLVSTGQQPGLFLGPLYTLYKALTAVRVAEALERESGIPAMASFWVASDDHDWDEVATCRILDPAEAVRELRLPPPVGRAGRSVGPTPLPEEVAALLDRLREEGGGPVAGAPPAWFEALCAAYRPGRTFSDAFIDALLAATTGMDLAVLDSAQPEVRRRAATLYARIAAEPGRVIDAMSSGRQAVIGAGYSPALTPPENGLQFFRDDGTGRKHVLYADERFDAGSGEPEALDELRAALESDPAGFSPAAALRPVVESLLLPVAATVLGPGEVAYWAQLRPLFGALDATMPTIVPRDAWTLVEPPVDHLLEKIGADPSTLESAGADYDRTLVRHARPAPVGARLADVEQAMISAFEELRSAVDESLPGLKSAAGKARHRVEEALAEFEGTVDRSVAAREGTLLGQVKRARAHLAPGGIPQERVFGVAQLLGKYGAGLAADLLAASRVAGEGGQD